MKNSTARLLVGACAILVAALAIFNLWQLWWIQAGLEAFALDTSQPTPGGPPQQSLAAAEAHIESYAGWRLKLLTFVVPITAGWIALVLAVVAGRLRCKQPPGRVGSSDA